MTDFPLPFLENVWYTFRFVSIVSCLILIPLGFDLMKSAYRTVGLLILSLCCFAGLARAQTPDKLTGQRIACTNGIAASFPCGNVDLMAYLPIAEIGGQLGIRVNDLWGWTDPQTGHEYALVGRSDGTAFIDLTDPLNPIFVGDLPKTEGANSSLWRDIKVYNDHAFVVSENAGAHGMQIFDLTQLRDVTDPPVTFVETAHYAQVTQAHNLAINEETGFAYIVGANDGGITCGGGLHMVNIQDPLHPTFAGCFVDPFTGQRGTGYTHDVQCVVYHGPDADYQGREICFGANVTALSIVDVTDKPDRANAACGNCIAVARGTYPSVGYAHQGWLTEDHRYFLLDDETDELTHGFDRPHTYVFDLTDLDDPQLLTVYLGTTRSIDHNLYIVGDYAFQANYTSGLRILDLSDIENPREVAFFDTVPGEANLGFGGAWSVYPFFQSGVIVVSSISQGVFIVEATSIQVATETDEAPAQFVLSQAFPNPFNPQTSLTLTLAQAQPVRVAVYDVLGREVAVLQDGALPAGVHPLTFEATGLPSGTYLVRAIGTMTVQTRFVTLAK